MIGIDHIELVVKDVDTFVNMFKAMGFELLTRTTHHGGSAEMKLPGENQVIFELHSVAGEENPGMNHIAFLTDDIERDRQVLMDAGFNVSAANLVKATGRTLANWRDPDGFRQQMTDIKRVEPIIGETSTNINLSGV